MYTGSSRPVVLRLICLVSCGRVLHAVCIVMYFRCRTCKRRDATGTSAVVAGPGGTESFFIYAQCFFFFVDTRFMSLTREWFLVCRCWLLSFRSLVLCRCICICRFMFRLPGCGIIRCILSVGVDCAAVPHVCSLCCPWHA